MGKAGITWSAVEDGDGDSEAQHRWFVENDLRAREAMVAAGIWYGPRPPAGQRAPAARLVDRVLDAVAAVTSIGRADLEGASRQAHVAAARQVAFFILSNHCGFGHKDIAKSFGCERNAVAGACHRIEAARQDFECWIGPTLARIGAEP